MTHDNCICFLLNHKVLFCFLLCIHPLFFIFIVIEKVLNYVICSNTASQTCLLRTLNSHFPNFYFPIHYFVCKIFGLFFSKKFSWFINVNKNSQFFSYLFADKQIVFDVKNIIWIRLNVNAAIEQRRRDDKMFSLFLFLTLRVFCCPSLTDIELDIYLKGTGGKKYLRRWN